ncbi:MAG: replication-associated recombination protein A [Cytophagales bacterium]|nr:replication-associated recombination protein A [Cytophagales bacterium]
MQQNTTPLAERMRPHSLETFIGQKHLVGANGILRKIISSQILPSMIFWGPPGVGKTTLANIIANQINTPFYALNAIQSGIKDIRDILQKAKGGIFKPVLFIDEIHRFNKGQQDALLNAVEKGHITLIGATTENPSFEVNSALLSRCQVYTLQNLTEEDLLQLVHWVIQEDKELQQKEIHLEEYEALFQLSNGDARKILNLLELIVNQANNNDVKITNELVKEIAQQTTLNYDKSGDMHYDIISAFIKSIRGGDPNASLYWLARMIEAGEDAKFIARRLLIAASEDIGLANPTALVMANNCFQAVNVIGFPEARIILSQTTIYLATSPKSNSAYQAINQAQELVKHTGNLSVPLHLRGAYTQLNQNLGYGKDYLYPHNFPNHFVPQEYFPEEIAQTKLYQPAHNGREQEIKQRLSTNWNDKYDY